MATNSNLLVGAINSTSGLIDLLRTDVHMANVSLSQGDPISAEYYFEKMEQHLTAIQDIFVEYKSTKNSLFQPTNVIPLAKNEK